MEQLLDMVKEEYREQFEKVLKIYSDLQRQGAKEEVFNKLIKRCDENMLNGYNGGSCVTRFNIEEIFKEVKK